MLYRSNPRSAAQRHRDRRDPVHKWRFAYRVRGVENPRFARFNIAARLFIPTLLIREERAKSRPARVRSFFFFLRVPVTLRSPAEKASADDGRVYTIVCTVVRAHILAPISHRLPSSMWTCSRDTHTCASERASRDRGGKFHSRIHSPRKQIPSLSRIYWNNLGKYDKFGYEICRRACELSRLSCLCLSASISPSPSHPPRSRSLSRPAPNPTLLLYLVSPVPPFVLLATCAVTLSGIANLSPTRLEWYLLKIGSIATWVFACSSYTFRLPPSYNVYMRVYP